MERAIALKKLQKLLGKKFGYQIDKGAPSKDEREAARVAIKEVSIERDLASKAMLKRRDEVLAADTEYQMHLVVYTDRQKRFNELRGITLREKITVGTSNSMFFHVAATGDSWEEVIAKVEKKEHVF